MIRSYNRKELEEKIHQYINGKLSDAEVEELWIELIQDEYYLDYMKSAANLKAVVENKREKEQKAKARAKTYWSYATAAVIALTIGVITVLNSPDFDSGTALKPIQNIELDYYRSSEGGVSNDDGDQVIRKAISLANTGNFDEAVALLNNELEVADSPRWTSEVLLNLGSLHYNQGNYNNAVALYKKVIEIKRDINVLTLEKAYWYLGNAHFQIGQLENAKENIEKAYDLNGAYRRVSESYLKALSD